MVVTRHWLQWACMTNLRMEHSLEMQCTELAASLGRVVTAFLHACCSLSMLVTPLLLVCRILKGIDAKLRFSKADKEQKKNFYIESVSGLPNANFLSPPG